MIIVNVPMHLPHVSREKNWPRGYKTFFMLNSAVLEISIPNTEIAQTN